MASTGFRHRIVEQLARLAGKGLPRELGRCAYRSLRRMSFSVPGRGRHAVVFAGDSLTDQWATLAEDFPALNVVNRGISGDVSAQLLRRFKADVLACNPRAIVILIGTNDLADGITPARVAACLRRMLALAAGVPVVICRVLPRGEVAGLFPEKIRELNSRIERLCKNRAGVSDCDTFAPLAESDGMHRRECFVDGLHLNQSGYCIITAALMPHLIPYAENSSDQTRNT